MMAVGARGGLTKPRPTVAMHSWSACGAAYGYAFFRYESATQPTLPLLAPLVILPYAQS